MNEEFDPTIEDIFGKSQADQLAWEAARYEEELVAHLLTRYNLQRFRSAIYEKARRDPEPRLTLEAFHEVLPSFPIYLVSALFTPKQRQGDANVTRLFSDFARRRFVREFDKLADRIPSWVCGAVGLVFRWPRLKGQVLTDGAVFSRERGGDKGLVLHNRHITEHVPGVRLLWVSPDGKKLVLEPLSVLLKSIDYEETGSVKKRWAPEG